MQFIFENDKRVLKKCPYRNAKGKLLLFIGDPVRVQVRYENLRSEIKQKKAAWLKRFKKKFKPPPDDLGL
ncbi:MAG: hypothetical protein HQM16_15900 [Deltaproteobacteria bacterium]|nr:hypothetical protein [Deltaproteobacteria bacterium]